MTVKKLAKLLTQGTAPPGDVDAAFNYNPEMLRDLQW
jgi:hypothetical protein